MNEHETPIKEKMLYFDCYSGISGDMTLGALLDLGINLPQLQEILSGLDLDGYSLEVEKVNRGGICGTRAVVTMNDNPPVRRNLPDILCIIEDSSLPYPVKIKSKAVFQNLAEAEAVVHNIPVEKVHFHEVGAVDAMVDIIGSAAAMYLLGIDSVYCSPLPVGRGMVHAAHGRLPLPAPATLELLAMRKTPVYGSDYQFELVTPTGAAIVTTLADSFGPLPALNIDAIGYGAGSIDPGYANYLRLLLGYRQSINPSREEEVTIIETNIDDLNPEIFGFLMDRLFAAGALDVYYTPVHMKKNRPAVQLTVLSAPDNIESLQNLVFSETSTLGLRLTTTRKIVRHREIFKVETKWGQIRIKYCPVSDQTYPLHFSPEYEDCCNVAKLSGLPLREVYRMAERLFRNQY